jgi:hypothetical protein
MKSLINIFTKLRQWRCKHVYVDLVKIGYQRCIDCGKERVREFKSYE